jgi:hypothetical protein
MKDPIVRGHPIHAMQQYEQTHDLLPHAGRCDGLHAPRAATGIVAASVLFCSLYDARILAGGPFYHAAAYHRRDTDRPRRGPRT